MKYQAQCFKQLVISKAFKAEERAFFNNVKIVYKQDVPDGPNIVSNHTIYKVKLIDNFFLKLKARICASWESRRPTLRVSERLYSMPACWLTYNGVDFVVNGVDCN